MQILRVGEVRFDRRRGAYSACVDLERNGQIFRYPCEVHGPPDMDPAWVMNALSRAALALSDRRRDGRILH